MKLFLLLGPWVLSLLAVGGFIIEERRVTDIERKAFRMREYNPARPSPVVEMARIFQRLDKLEGQLALVQLQASSAPTPTAAQAPAAAGPSKEIQQLREDVDALLTGEAAGTEQGKARLRQIIAETQQQQMAERQQHRDERILSRLTETARLSQQQHDDLAKVLEQERNTRRDLMAKARSADGNMDDIRPAMQALRAQTEKKAGAILNAEQLSQFQAARAPGRGMRGGGPNQQP